MDPFGIVCDSGHNLPPDIVQKLRLQVVPYTINFGLEGSIDDGVMPVEEFAELLDRYEKGKGYPTTAAPPPSRFVDVFTSHIRQGLSKILTITISAKLSKTHESAVQAAEEVGQQFPDSEIEVVDSRSGSMAEGFLLLEAARARDLGRPLQEAKHLVEELRSRLRLLAAFETTKYLVKSGRARLIQHLLSSHLSIRPVLTVREGAVSLYARVRGRMEKAVDRIAEEVQQTYKSGMVSVVEGLAPDLKEMLVGRLCQRLGLNREQILETKVGPTFLVHTGSRVVGVIWEQEEQDESGLTEQQL